ncbi:early nodulin-75-like protein [Leptotrombidium deliense]|uniref:Early nodulin-75-like protein n=1 Tax=Leptotrombidium deliense TaxID=299467 RepID=A0A443SSB9_9ACAR|nr:early nodulin-75-like protein [Leptotrombidium deliense]
MQFSLFKLIVIATLCYCSATAEHRQKRQLVNIQFPGPRATNTAETDFKSEETNRRSQYDDSINRYSPQNVAASQTYRPQLSDAGYSTPYSQPQAQYAPEGYRGNARSSGGYGPPPKAYSKPSTQNYGSQSLSSSDARSSKKSPEEEAEEEQKPSKLELLLQTSKFGCSGKKDGYYADSSVNCEVFHYCVSGAKHSWMCPEGTVFHQVHLNCVPASQDICSESDKYSSQVNDFLYKPLDQRGPNNTVRYHQRFYPEEFLGDPLLSAFPQTQSYGYPQPNQASPQKPQAQPQPSRPSYSNDYDSSYNSNEDDYRPSVPVRPVPAPQPKPSYNPSYPSYQPKPPQAQIPASVYNKPVAKPAPAPIAYTPPSYRPQSAPEQRRPASSSSSYPEYNSNNYAAAYTPSVNKPVPQPAYNTYPSSYAASPAKPSSSGYSPQSGYQSSYKPNSSGYSPSANYQPSAPSYKPNLVSNAPKPSSGSYSSYPAYPSYSSASYDSSETSSDPRYGNQRPTLRTPNEYSGVAYEEDY